MSKGGSSAPPPPDPTATIAAQTAANKAAVTESARVNAVDIYGPNGSTTYTRGADGVPTAQHTTLDPASQAILNRQRQIGGTLADTANNRLQGISQTNYTTSGLPYHPGSYDTNTMPKFSASSVGRGGSGGVGGSGPMGVGGSGMGGSGGVSQPPRGPMGVGGSGSGGSGGVSQPVRQPGPANPNAVATPDGGAFGVKMGSQGAPMIPGSPATGQQNPAGASVGDGTVMPYDQRSYGNMDYFRSQVGDAMYNQGMSRINPQIEQSNEQFEQRMKDQGIPVDSPAYQKAKESMARQQNDLVSSLANGATTASLGATQGIVGMEQGLRSSAWNENMQGSQQSQADWLRKMGVEQDIRGRINTDNLAERNQSINEVSMMLGASPQMQMPNAPNMAQYNVQAPDVAGITNSAYNAQMNAYNAQQNRNASNMNGAFGIAAAALPYAMSSSMLKTDISDA